MKDIASYYDKTIAQTKQNIRETETYLKSVTATKKYFQIEETIKTNETKTKRFVHQRKFKKFNSLKYKPETTREETLQSTKEPTAFQKSYANAVSGANNGKYNNDIISRNTSNTKLAKEPQTFLGKLEAQNPRKLQQRHGKIPSRSNSKTNLTFNSKDERIERLKNEIRQLKQSKKNNTLSDTQNAETTRTSKNVHAASKSGGQTEINTKITKVMTFIEQTMQTLSVYNEKLKTCLNTDQIHLEVV